MIMSSQHCQYSSRLIDNVKYLLKVTLELIKGKIFLPDNSIEDTSYQQQKDGEGCVWKWLHIHHLCYSV